MVLLEDIPALIYSAFWPMKLDGRLAAAAGSERISMLICFYDYQPSALLTIDRGDFRVESLVLSSKESMNQYLANNEIDIVISGYFRETVEMTGGIGSILNAVFKRKIKIKHRLKAFRLLKMLGVETTSIEGVGIKE